jgi:hypothetical protein
MSLVTEIETDMTRWWEHLLSLGIRPMRLEAYYGALSDPAAYAQEIFRDAVAVSALVLPAGVNAEEFSFTMVRHSLIGVDHLGPVYTHGLRIYRRWLEGADPQETHERVSMYPEDDFCPDTRLRSHRIADWIQMMGIAANYCL